jgi:hypothetical protein
MRCTELAGIDPSARLLSRISAISSWPVSVSPRTAMTSIAEPSTRPATVDSRFLRVTGIGTGTNLSMGPTLSLCVPGWRAGPEGRTKPTITPLIGALCNNRVKNARSTGIASRKAIVSRQALRDRKPLSDPVDPIGHREFRVHRPNGTCGFDSSKQRRDGYELGLVNPPEPGHTARYTVHSARSAPGSLCRSRAGRVP